LTLYCFSLKQGCSTKMGSGGVRLQLCCNTAHPAIPTSTENQQLEAWNSFKSYRRHFPPRSRHTAAAVWRSTPQFRATLCVGFCFFLFLVFTRPVLYRVQSTWQESSVSYRIFRGPFVLISVVVHAAETGVQSDAIFLSGVPYTSAS
jgi:hypothetical protein